MKGIDAMNLRNMVNRAALALAIVAGGAALNWAQVVESDPADRAEIAVVKVREAADRAAKQAAEVANFKFKTMNDRYMSGGSRPLEMGIREAAVQVRDAKDETARTAASAELTKLLDEYFEADVKNREQELADVAARLQKLQQQLDRRRAKKQEIIDLQLKVALNEADGLGFFGQPTDQLFEIRVPAPMDVPVRVNAWSGNPFGGTIAPPSPPASADVK
jgi:hypothetical protein